MAARPHDYRFPAAFTAPIPADDECDRHWRHYLAEPTARNFDRLYELYIPVAFKLAWCIFRTIGPRLRTAMPLEDVVSECLIALPRAIERSRYEGPRQFQCFAKIVMRGQVWMSCLAMRWGGRERLNDKGWQVR